MALDLWDLWNNQVAQESSSFTQSGWHCDFYFGHGFDVIEENALNEKYCVQVLRILIKKADSEIDELENDLFSLQSELAWAEHEDWSNICCKTLKEKIDCLDISIRSLKGQEKNDIEVHLLMHTEPFQRVHEIVKTLLTNYFQEKDVKPVNANVKDVSQQLACDHSGEKKSSNKFEIKSPRKGEAKHGCTLKDRSRIQDSSLKHEDQGRHGLETLKAKCAQIESTSGTDALKHAIVHSNKKKRRNDSDLKVGSKEVEEHSSMPTAGIIIIESLLEPVRKRRDAAKEVKPANRILKDSGSNSHRDATSNNFHEMKKSCKFDLKVYGHEEIKEHCPAATGKSKIFGSPPNPESEGNLSPTNKPAKTTVKNIAPDALRRAAGFYWRRENFNSSLAAFSQAKGSRNLDMEEKLCDLAVKTARKWNVKELKVPLTNKIVSSNLSLKSEGNKKIPTQFVKDGEAGLSDTEHSAVTSLLELQDQKGENTANPQSKDEEKPQSDAEQITEIDASVKKSNVNLSSKIKKLKSKRSTESNLPSVHEFSFSVVGTASLSSSFSEEKKRQKPGGSPDNPSSNQCLNRKIRKKLIRHCEDRVKEHSADSDDRQNPVLQPQKKRKRNSPIAVEIKSSTAQEDIPVLHRDSSDGESKGDLSIIESCSIDDSGAEAVASLPSTTINLKDLKLVDLRAIAKRHKLTNYYKLRRTVLLEQLVKELGCC